MANHRMKRVSQLLPDLETIETAIGTTESWVSNCYYIATKLLQSGLLAPISEEFGDIKVCYGHFTGEVDERSPFARKPVIRHGWLELPEGIVIDPTHWVFTQEAPHITITSVTDYDLAGRRLRLLVARDKAPPDYDSDGAIRWTINDPEATDAVASLLGETSRINDGFLGRGQAHWVANLPLSILGNNARTVYHAFDLLGLKALIPIDHRNYVHVPEDGASLSL